MITIIIIIYIIIIITNIIIIIFIIIIIIVIIIIRCSVCLGVSTRAAPTPCVTPLSSMRGWTPLRYLESVSPDSQGVFQGGSCYLFDYLSLDELLSYLIIIFSYHYQGGSCYLFDCGSLDELKCQFTANPDFSAAVLDIDRHKFDILAEDRRQVSDTVILTLS